jgi:hypothetical protein
MAAKFLASAGGQALKGVAQTQGKALLNQGKKQAVQFAAEHKNQAITMTQNYLKQKAGALGRAANARVNQALGLKRPNNKRLNNVRR